MTVRDLIKGSMRLLGVLSVSEQPTADQANDAFIALNELIDTWSTESLMIYSKVTETFPLVVAQQVYTMGPTGDFNTVRPQLIEQALIQFPNGQVFELPMDILSQDQWANITVKDVTSSIPTRLYNDCSFPLANIYIWPIPNQVTNIILWSWKPLASFVTINDTVLLPPGYLMALRYNLAMQLSSEYGVMPSEIVMGGALSSKANVKRMNSRPIYLGIDSALLTRTKKFNYLTGE